MTIRPLMTSFAAATVVACATKPPPTPPPPPKAVLVLATHSDVNPDASGRPSPVVMRLYELKSDTAFAGSGFFNLFDDERKALGADLIARDEYQLIPGERRILELTPPPEMRFLGAVAAFHDVRNSSWRALLPVPKDGLDKARIEVVADTSRIRIELGH